MRLLLKTILPTSKIHTGTVIFFHGSGSSGSELYQSIRFILGKDLGFPQLKIILPTAPLQPYSLCDGEPSNVWFDRKELTPQSSECKESLEHIYEDVNELIRLEVEQGIPTNRIVVGGFSMGGALALHSAFHLNRSLAGVFACSSFLNHDSNVYNTLSQNASRATLPKLLMFHGDRDDMVKHEWGRHTFDKLTEFGVDGKFVTVKNAFHELKLKELHQTFEWIDDILKPLEHDDASK